MIDFPTQSIDVVKRTLLEDVFPFKELVDMFYYSFEMPFLKKNRPGGVYLLGDFYIGKSGDYSSRVLNHKNGIKEALNGYGTAGKTSAEGAIKWFDRYKNRRIPVFHMSNNYVDEYEVALKLIGAGFPIVNDLKQCHGYYNLNMTDKELGAINYLSGLGYNISIPESRKHLIIPNKEA